MGAKKKQRETEHRAKKKAKSAIRTRVPAKPDLGPLTSILMEDQVNPTCAIYDNEPGSFILTGGGWVASSPFHGLIKLAFDVPDPKLVFDAIISLAKATGRSFVLTPRRLAELVPDEPADVYFGNRARFGTAISRPGDLRMESRCDQIVETDWLPRDQFLLIDSEHPSDVGRLADWEGDGGGRRYGAVIRRLSFYHVAIQEKPVRTVVGWDGRGLAT